MLITAMKGLLPAEQEAQKKGKLQRPSAHVATLDNPTTAAPLLNIKSQ
jgi:hypothetical protein